MSAANHLSPAQFFHGTAHDLKPGDLIDPGRERSPDYEDPHGPYAYLSRSPDYSGTYGHVYHVEPTGPVETDIYEPKQYRSASPLRVVAKVKDAKETAWNRGWVDKEAGE
jgi:hypothetical protein